MRDNILFGKAYDKAAYKKVVEACALEHDLAMWEHGDQTLVGERGVALSGGQKARVTLARAIYRFVELCTGCSLIIVFFPLIFGIFLNSANSAAALVFYLPFVCTHTGTEGKQRKTRVRNILKSLKQNTIFNEHPV